MFKLKKIGVSMVLASLMLLAMVVPAFADNMPVNLEIYKENGSSLSMAQKSVKDAYITDDNNLVINTKYFFHIFTWGTMKQLAYNLDGTPIQSTVNQAGYREDGQISIPLVESVVADLNDGDGVAWLNRPGVKSSVYIIGEHTPTDYRNVQVKLSLPQVN